MRKKSITVQVISLVAGAVLLCAFLAVLLFSFVSERYIIQTEISRLENKAVIVSDILEGYFSEQVELAVMTRQFPRERSLWDADIYIYDIDGEVFMTSQLADERYEIEQNHIDHALNSETTREEISTKYGVYLLASRSVLNQDGNRTATVVLLEPVAQINRSRRLQLTIMLFSIAVVFLLMVPAAVLLVKHIIRPIERMGAVANEMAEGNLDCVIEDGNVRELTGFSDTLNHLSRSLGNTISALRLERNRLRRMIDDMNEGVICITGDNEIDMYNLSAVRLLDVQNEDTVSVEKLVTEVLGGHLREVRAQQGAASFDIQRADRTIHIDMVCLHGEREQEDSIMVILQDLTEERRLQQIQNDYVANVSHEIRTPLTAIRALAEPLNDGMVKDEKTRQQYYHTILHETIRMTRLITDVSELGRLRTGRVVFDKNNVDLTDLFMEIQVRYAILTKEKNQTLEVQVPPDMEPVYTNADRVEQCLAALMDNAIKYTPEGGKIGIYVTDRGEDILVSVRDNGVGIPEEDLPHIFERFFQVDRSHRTEGSGLGLAIVQLVIEGMGENIRVSSVEGKGTTFSFTVHRLPGRKNIRCRQNRETERADG